MFVILETLPLTDSGKVDRQRLPDPPTDRPQLSSEWAEPITPVERVVAEIVREVLGIERSVGRMRSCRSEVTHSGQVRWRRGSAGGSESRSRLMTAPRVDRRRDRGTRRAVTTAAIVGAAIGGLGAALAWPAIAFLIPGVLMGAVVGLMPGLARRLCQTDIDSGLRPAGRGGDCLSTIVSIRASFGAERHADADVVSALRDEMRHHSVHANDGED